MSKSFEKIDKILMKLENNIDNLEKKLVLISSQIDRVNDKVDHIINFLEFLVAEETEEELEEDDIYDTDESWAKDPDSWKNEEYYDDEEEEF